MITLDIAFEKNTVNRVDEKNMVYLVFFFK